MECTSRNCGGGKTYWQTWVTCEENGLSGQVLEVNPRSEPTVLGDIGGNYESFAYDARDRFNPTFYVTHDSAYGELVRFTSNLEIVVDAERTGDYSKQGFDHNGYPRMVDITTRVWTCK